MSLESLGRSIGGYRTGQEDPLFYCFFGLLLLFFDAVISIAVSDDKILVIMVLFEALIIFGVFLSDIISDMISGR